jgi:predicted phage-related endonuclease
MLVTGYQYGYFAILIFGYSGVEDFQILEVQRDEKFIENILFPILFDFWNNHIIPRVPPEPKTINDVQILYPSPVEGKTLVATPEMVDKILRLKEVREALKPLEDEKKQIEDELKFEIADAEAIVLGSETLATYKKSKDSLKFDTKRFEAENPELAQKYSVLVPGPRRLLIK